jgi:putative YphP/YqiW family bacilliredoxin
MFKARTTQTSQNQEIQRLMMYDEMMIAPMRRELTDLGIAEARTPQAVDASIKSEGTTLVVVNSVCGCAAANARPGVAYALEHGKKPTNAITVFAGNDREATAQARTHMVGYQPSSPSIALFKNGDLVFMMERYQIAGRDAEDIGKEIMSALESNC